MPDFCALWRALNDSAGDRWGEVAVAPLAHRTRPMNYSGANSRSWRVPEPLFPGAPLDFPEGEEFSVKSPGAPDTVRCATGQSGAPDQGDFRDAFSSLF